MSEKKKLIFWITDVSIITVSFDCGTKLQAGPFVDKDQEPTDAQAELFPIEKSFIPSLPYVSGEKKNVIEKTMNIDFKIIPDVKFFFGITLEKTCVPSVNCLEIYLSG